VPRKRRTKAAISLPPKHFKTPAAILVNISVSDAAYRLYNLILALGWKDGYVDCYNSELGDYLSWNRQKVSRVLRELLDLVDATTLADGRQRLTPADPGDLPSGLAVAGLFDPADATDQNLEGAKPSSRTPHNNSSNGSKKGIVTKTRRYPSQKCDDTPLHDDDSLNTLNHRDSSSSKTAVSSQKRDNTFLPVQNCDDTSPFEVWDRYFGENQRASDVLEKYLADPVLHGVAVAAEQTPTAWLIAAIDKTAAYEPKKPLPYFQKIIRTQLAEAATWASVQVQDVDPPPLPAEGPAPAPDLPDKLAALWADVTNMLQGQMSKNTFDTLLKRTVLISVDGGVWMVEVESNYAKEWLENRLNNQILRALKQFVDGPIELKFIERGD